MVYMWLTLTNTEVDEVNVNEVNVNVPEGHAVDQGVGLPELLPDLAVPLRQSGHLGEVVSPELNYPANTQL